MYPWDGGFRVFGVRYDNYGGLLIETEKIWLNPPIQPLTSIKLEPIKDEYFSFDAEYNLPNSSPDIAVTVMEDGGVDYNNPKIAHRLVRNHDDPVDGLDNDRNGFI